MYFFLIISISFLSPLVSLAENFSGFHKSYLSGAIEVKQIEKQIIINILDKIYEYESNSCKEYGASYGLGNNQFYIKNNPFSIINISDDDHYDLIIDTKEFNCSESGDVTFRGGTGGHEYIVILNPSIDSIADWANSKEKVTWINAGEKEPKVSKNGVYTVFTRSWVHVDGNLIFEIHGTFCDEAGYLQCYTAYKASFEQGFIQLVMPTHTENINEFNLLIGKSQ